MNKFAMTYVELDDNGTIKQTQKFEGFTFTELIFKITHFFVVYHEAKVDSLKKEIEYLKYKNDDIPF